MILHSLKIRSDFQANSETSDRFIERISGRYSEEQHHSQSKPRSVVIQHVENEYEEQNNALSAENASLEDQLKSVKTLGSQLCKAI